MSRRHLEELIENYNFWPRLRGQGRILDIDTLTQADATSLYHRIDSDLSPENLTCDGELPAAQVRQRAQMLQGAVAELDRSFQRPAELWCIR